MDWVDRSQNFKGFYGILQIFQSSHLDNFPLKTLKLGWVATHSLTFQLKIVIFNLINIKNSLQCSTLNFHTNVSCSLKGESDCTQTVLLILMYTFFSCKLS